MCGGGGTSIKLVRATVEAHPPLHSAKYGASDGGNSDGGLWIIGNFSSLKAITQNMIFQIYPGVGLVSLVSGRSFLVESTLSRPPISSPHPPHRVWVFFFFRWGGGCQTSDDEAALGSFVQDATVRGAMGAKDNGGGPFPDRQDLLRHQKPPLRCTRLP